MNDHLKDYIKRYAPLGVGVYAEQASESVHADFDAHWDRYRVKDPTSDKYGPQLLRAVLSYNAQHI